MRQAQTYGLESDACLGLRFTQVLQSFAADTEIFEIIENNQNKQKFRTAGGAASAAFSPDMVLQARRGFQTQLSQTLSSASTSFDATSAAVVSAAALFEELLPALAASNAPVRALLGEGSGPSAAVALYQHALDAVPLEVLPNTLFAGFAITASP